MSSHRADESLSSSSSFNWRLLLGGAVELVGLGLNANGFDGFALLLDCRTCGDGSSSSAIDGYLLDLDNCADLPFSSNDLLGRSPAGTLLPAGFDLVPGGLSAEIQIARRPVSFILYN